MIRLPGATSHLFGREHELSLLDKWRKSSGTGVFLWVADGGIGKSTLVRSWLQAQDWAPGTRFLGHSFYRQGTRGESANARSFLIESLRQLSITHANEAPDTELGQLLAEALASRPTVLVLDGMEPLQDASGGVGKPSRISDAGLATLLEQLARQPGAALCLATSRLPIANDSIRSAPAFQEQVLDVLPPPAAQALLRYRGMAGADEELESVAEHCGYQALALVLAAEFCHSFLDGAARALLARDWVVPVDGRNAATVMTWLEAALAEEHQALDQELMHILGLFDRPAPWGALQALQAAEPPIAQLTERLHAADAMALSESLARLAQWGILQADLAAPTPELDSHPLVREHFATHLAKEAPEAWRRAHKVLFEWFCQQPEKHQPDTLEELEPLYRAVRHGCLASLYPETLNDVYHNRIARGSGPDGFYSTKKLGAYGADLGAVACFFTEPWRRLVPDLPANAQAWLLNAAAVRLRALGQLALALEPMRASGEMDVQVAQWEGAAISYGNLSELQLSLGRIAPAIADAECAVNCADKLAKGNAKEARRIVGRAALADALHQQGDLAAAYGIFAEAEAIQAEYQPKYPLLYSARGFRYCDLLLAEAERAAWRGAVAGEESDGCAQVVKRAAQALAIAKRNNWLLAIALDQLTLSRCALYADRLHGRVPGDEAQRHTEAAVAGLRQAGTMDFLPSALLTRALLRHCHNDTDGAHADLIEAQGISERGDMKLYLADIALTRARLFDDGDELARARALIEECGYGRRLSELEDAEKRLGLVSAIEGDLSFSA